jgi:putative endopeptidase
MLIAAANLSCTASFSKIGQPVDRTEWSVSPSVPNAYYDPQLNAITFPAAILQPPLFDRTSDDAANFGAIGAIIGHKLTHGFDDQGSKFDAAGNLHDWWTAEDGKEFDKREQCVADEYSGFEATEGVRLNGKLTLGENTADNGGLRIAFMALESTLSNEDRGRTDGDGFSPEQRFFMAYGESWAQMRRPNIRLMAQSDPHSNPRTRANGGIEYAGVSESLRLQEGAAHGAGECLSRLVDSLRENFVLEGHGLRGCGKTIGWRRRSSGAKARIFLIVYGPTKVVP